MTQTSCESSSPPIRSPEREIRGSRCGTSHIIVYACARTTYTAFGPPVVRGASPTTLFATIYKYTRRHPSRGPCVLVSHRGDVRFLPESIATQDIHTRPICFPLSHREEYAVHRRRSPPPPSPPRQVCLFFFLTCWRK